MKFRAAIQLSVIVVSLFSAVRSASANFNFFTPVAASGFSADCCSPNIMKTPYEIYNNSTTTTENVLASLGHAAGGTNGFTFYGQNNAGFLQCTVWVVSSYNGSSYTYSGSTSAFGPFTIVVHTTPPGGDYFYSANCALAPASFTNGVSSLFGVAPDH